MTTFALSDKKMRLADKHGEVLGGRVLGEEIRAAVVRQVKSGENVVLDLDGVQAVSPSFADEIFGKLPLEVDDHVTFANVSRQIQAVADMARAGRAGSGSGEG
jgi:hypothetical protein